MLMLCFVFLKVEVREIAKSFSDARFSVSALSINFIITPLLAWALSKLFLAGETDLQLGFIMLLVTPCTDWYLIFTGLAGGNVSLGASILPLNLILQIILLPAYVALFMGTGVSWGFSVILRSGALVLAAPLVTATMAKILAKKTRRQDKLLRLAQKADDIQLALLCLAVIAMFASQGAAALANTLLFIKLAPPLLVFFALVFGLSLFAGALLQMPFKNTVSLLFTASARNSPVALAIATITFPLRPAVALVLAMGPLLELPALALNCALLKKIGKLRS
jgi:ACR3 family arsenite efflux pump ArsB